MTVKKPRKPTGKKAAMAKAEAVKQEQKDLKKFSKSKARSKKKKGAKK